MQKLPRSFYNRDTILVAANCWENFWFACRTAWSALAGSWKQKLIQLSRSGGTFGAGIDRAQQSNVRPARPRLCLFHLWYYFCMNVVTEREGHASAVLLRAIEPVKNIEARTQGPGLLCRAMNIDKRLNARDLQSEDFYIAAPPQAEPMVIVKRRRVGVDYAGHWAKRHLRFYIKGNPFVSRP
jgi:DNA-3-methyladenine glycosylase